MDLKEKAFSLYQKGLSYNEIAKSIGISKTRAYEYVKETRLIISGKIQKPVQNGSERPKPPHSEQLTNVVHHSNQEYEEEAKDNNLDPQIKVFTGDELIQKELETLNFSGKFLDLIGKPSRPFSGIIWGLPKGGKSNLSIRFADYLQEYFGQVCYIAAEEGESVALQEKFKQIGGSKVTVAESRNKETIRSFISGKEFDFVFIDSINTAGIDSDYLELLKEENPKKSFVSVVQATKGGNFRGDQALTHNCDFILKVENGIVHHTGRFGEASQIEIFNEPLYQKNPGPLKEIMPVHRKPTVESNHTFQPEDEDPAIEDSNTPLKSPVKINPTNRRLPGISLEYPDFPKSRPQKPILPFGLRAILLSAFILLYSNSTSEE